MLLVFIFLYNLIYYEHYYVKNKIQSDNDIKLYLYIQFYLKYL